MYIIVGMCEGVRVCVCLCEYVKGILGGDGDQVKGIDSKEALLHGEARAGRTGCHGDVIQHILT